MIVTDAELTRRLFEVIDSLSDEERKEFREALVSWADEKEKA